MEAGRIILRREDGGATVQPQPEVDQHRALQQTPLLNVSDIYLTISVVRSQRNVAHIILKSKYSVSKFKV